MSDTKPMAEVKQHKSSLDPPSPNYLWITLGLAAFIVIGLIILWQLGYFNRPGQAVRILGRDHIQPGQTPKYNSLPPTSGPHYANALADWGVHDEEIEEPLQVANLEKGGVLIQYRPRENLVLPDADRDRLQILTRHLRGEPRYCKLIVAPAAILDKKIALTAWGRIDKFDAYDEARILRFIDAYINKGPEDAPCL